MVFVFCFEESKYVSQLLGEPITPQNRQTSPAKQSGDVHPDPDRKSPNTGLFSVSTPSDDYATENHPQLRSRKERLRLVTRTDEPLLGLYLRPLEALFTMVPVAFTAIQFGFSLCWIAVISSVQAGYMFYAPWNFNAFEVGLLNLAPFIGLAVGAPLGGTLGDIIVVKAAKRNGGVFEPEMRLYTQFIPVILMTAGFMTFGYGIYSVSYCMKDTMRYLLITTTRNRGPPGQSALVGRSYSPWVGTTCP